MSYVRGQGRLQLRYLPTQGTLGQVRHLLRGLVIRHQRFDHRTTALTHYVAGHRPQLDPRNYAAPRKKTAYDPGMQAVEMIASARPFFILLG